MRSAATADPAPPAAAEPTVPAAIDKTIATVPARTSAAPPTTATPTQVGRRCRPVPISSSLP